MKKIITTMAMACLSFSCFAESYFVKVNANEYVLQHGEKSKDLGINNSGFGAVAPVDAVYTPTHVFTYPDGTPSLFRNIQKIEYTESNAAFYKSIKSRRCCIDILDDKENAKKCRIIGVNGHNIGSFEVYEVADEANSFTDSTPRLIFVDHTGLYIVSEKENPIEDISKDYFRNRKFDFKGEIIKISAIDGKRETPKCAFNWPSEVPVSFDESMLAVKPEFIPFMEQIEKITGIMPQSAPPTFEAAKKRMAELLDIPEEVLVVEDKVVKCIVISSNSIRHVPYDDRKNYSKVCNQLLRLMPFARRELNDETLAVLEILKQKKYENYTFDYSDESKKRRKEIAQKPWDE